MFDHSEPNYRISHPKKKFSKDAIAENPLKEYSAASEDIEILGAQLRETKINLNGLLAKQNEFCEQFGKDMSDAEFARLANAIEEIRKNIACLQQMKEAIERVMLVVLNLDNIYKKQLEGFEGKIEN